MENSLFDRQIALEKEMQDGGIARYRAKGQYAKEKERETSTKPGARLLRSALQSTIEAVEAFFGEAETGKAGRRNVAYGLLKDHLDAPAIAMVATRSMLDSISQQKPLQSAALEIASRLYDQLKFRCFEEQKPYLWFAIVQSAKEYANGPARTMAKLQRATRMYEIDIPEWKREDRLHVGLKCIDLVIESTGMFEVDTTGVGKRSKKVLKATAETMEWLREADARCELLAPIYLPMLIPPLNWTTPYDGGYITNVIQRTPLVKSAVPGYLRDLEEQEMPEVYGAINAIQRTSWQINKRVLEVMNAVHQADTGMGSLPTFEEEPIPSFPLDRTDTVAVNAWKKQAILIHKANNKRRSRRIALIKTLWVADKFKDEDAIYFPHYLDFRGRIYPRTLFLTPQGADYCKGLLQFGEGKELGDRGAAWLAVHGANLWGYDKVDLDGRIRWVEENASNIVSAALAPLEFKWWADADKPWQFLAFCFEWAGYLREGETFRSQLPIALDGSCNGLQNFSMMLRDEIGGAAVNLVPSDKPQDIYQSVADVVLKKLEERVDNDPLAKAWLDSGLVNRKLCKKPVMTLPYGAKQYGMRAGIAEFIREAQESGAVVPWDQDTVFENAVYIGRVIWESIGEVVVAAREAMDFLQECASIAGKEAKAITWVTPAGFPVVQEYREDIAKRVQTKLAGQRTDLTLCIAGDKLDKKRQSSGISPNFVHSMDSSHLQKTVVLAEVNDVSHFAMIHDSYGTHACDTDVLGQALRESFVEQYEGDVLEEFRSRLVDSLADPGLRERVPEVPLKGTLDPKEVLESAFFFA